jgi:hypothetical protein
VTDAVTSGAIAAIALSSRRLAIQHQGQIASEITAMANEASPQTDEACCVAPVAGS